MLIKETLSRSTNVIQSDLGTLKSGRLIEVGRLTEVQYKLDRKGSKHDFMASIMQNAFKK